MTRPSTLAMALGGLSLALIVGVLGFQYLGGIPPCEMCHWQRWPHIAAAVIGLGGGLLIRAGLVEESLGRTLAWMSVLLIATSGGLGVYHAGVEWHWWPGPTACTTGFQYNGGPLDLNAPVPHCDIPAWTLLGISLAGFNALFSLAAAAFGAFHLLRKS